MSCYEFKGIKPVVHKSSFIHPLAAVTGNVVIGKNVYIGPGAAIRGDFGKIIIEDGCNVQENCTIHMFPGVTVVLKENSVSVFLESSTQSLHRIIREESSCDK